MKKLLLIIVTVLSMLFVFSACDDNKQPVYHAVTFESNGAKDYPGRTIEDGALIIKPENPTRAGYRFLGWYSGKKLWNFDSDRVKSNIHLVARWERNSYVVSFESDGIVIATQTVEEGNFATAPLTPTKENHRFLGWFYGSTEWDFNVAKILENTTLTAKWESFPTYTVTFDSDGGSAVAAEHIISGNKLTEPQAPTKANHEFLGWYLGDTKWDFDTPVTDSVTLRAKWKSTLTYKVTFNPNNGDDVFVREIPSGKTVTMPELVSTPLSVFDGWFYSGEPFNFDTPINSDITLVAKWKIFYVVTVDDGVNSPSEMTLESGSSIAAPNDPQNPGHKFMGWYYGDKKWSFTTDKVTSNMTLKARWEEIKTYTVTFDSNGGTPTPTAQQRPEGSNLTEPAQPEKDNAKFLGWYLGDKKWDFVKDKVSASITLTAKWQTKYTVTFNSDGGSAINPQTVLDGNYATKPENPTKKDNSFEGWYLGDKEWDFAKDKVTSNITLTAKWKPYPTYTVKFDSDGGTPVEEKHITKGYTVPEPPAPTKAEHTFIGWYFGDTKWDFANGKVTDNVTLKAKWEVIPKYTVTFDSDGGTQITAQTVLRGEYATKPSNPTKINNRFISWQKNGVDWDFQKTPITEDITLTAKWEEAPKFTVTFDSDGGTAIDSQTVFYGNTATRPAAPTKQGYTFRGWYKDGVEWNFESTAVKENITLKAVWDHTYVISFDSNGGNESVPSQSVIYGNYAKEPTPPTKDNCEFAGWYNGNQIWDFNTGITTSLELVARWNCTVIFNSDGGSAIDSQTVIYGNLAKEPTAPTKPHHDFLGWYVGDTDTEWSFTESAVNGSVTLTAKWREHPKYTVTFKIGEDTALIAAQTLYVNSLISEPDPDSIAKIRIKGWYLGDKEWDFAKDKLTENITLTAKTVNVYKVTFDTNGAAPIDPIIVEESELITGIADPQKTYHIFEGWRINGTNKFWNMETDRVTSDITLKAILTPLLPPDVWVP